MDWNYWTPNGVEQINTTQTCTGCVTGRRGRQYQNELTGAYLLFVVYDDVYAAIPGVAVQRIVYVKLRLTEAIRFRDTRDVTRF